MYDSITIANSILYTMGNIRKEIRPLKLQKLLYYTVGFYCQSPRPEGRGLNREV